MNYPTLVLRILFYVVGLPTALVLLWLAAMGSLVFFYAIFAAPSLVLAFLPSLVVLLGVVSYFTTHTQLSKGCTTRPTRNILISGLLSGAIATVIYIPAAWEMRTDGAQFGLLGVLMGLWIPICIHAAFLLTRLELVYSPSVAPPPPPPEASKEKSSLRAVMVCYFLLAIVTLAAFTDWMSGISMLAAGLCFVVCLPIMMGRFLSMIGKPRSQLDFVLSGLYPIFVIGLFLVGAVYD
ncbi:MAG: hypothetical protein WDZ30_04575 [Cellvibrionaceae bacterium]